VRPKDFVVVVGAGGVGGFAIQIAHSMGARVVALDVDPERLQLVARHGADWTLNPRDFTPKDLRKEIRRLAVTSGSREVEWRIFETSGTAPGQQTAFSLLNHGATLGVVGYHGGEVSIRLSNLMAFAARAQGTWGCLPQHFPAVLDMALSGRIALDPFIEFRPMSAIQETFEALRRGELKKRPVLLPDFDPPLTRR
jgi:6-hydroxycyclohex-1-ene-1-carbonyl-CoA dehydrogenase